MVPSSIYQVLGVDAFGHLRRKWGAAVAVAVVGALVSATAAYASVRFLTDVEIPSGYSLVANESGDIVDVNVQSTGTAASCAEAWGNRGASYTAGTCGGNGDRVTLTGDFLSSSPAAHNHSTYDSYFNGSVN